MTLNSSTVAATQTVLKTPGLQAFWDFGEEAGQVRQSKGAANYALAEAGGMIDRVAGGPFSGYAAEFTGSQYLTLPHSQLGGLNITGPDAQVTVVAWVKRADNKVGFLGGVWNEGDLKRQYGLFLDLSFYGGAENAIGHVSADGGPTPGYPYSRDYSANQTTLFTDQWYTAAFTFDGNDVRSYVDGKFEERSTYIDNLGNTYSKNPYFYPDGLSDAGGDFTVGAVRLGSTPGAMGNFFHGLIGGLAVYDRALTPAELFDLHAAGVAQGRPSIQYDFRHSSGSARTPRQLAWRAYVDGVGEVSGSSNDGWFVASQDGVDGHAGYLIRNTTGRAGLAWTDSMPAVTRDQIDRIAFTLNSSSADDELRIAVKVDGSWFVTDQTFATDDSDGAFDNWDTESERFTLNWTAEVSQWWNLTVGDDARLSVGDALDGDLPAGVIGAFGFYHDANQSSLRIDEIDIFTAVPESSAIVPFIVGAAAAAGRKRGVSTQA